MAYTDILIILFLFWNMQFSFLNYKLRLVSYKVKVTCLKFAKIYLCVKKFLPISCALFFILRGQLSYSIRQFLYGSTQRERVRACRFAEIYGGVLTGRPWFNGELKSHVSSSYRHKIYARQTAELAWNIKINWCLHLTTIPAGIFTSLTAYCM